jgi:hypothetical protein
MSVLQAEFNVESETAIAAIYDQIRLDPGSV